MSTTDDQKAGILMRWLEHRCSRGLGGDVTAQCKFNWPSLSSHEVSSVMKAYATRREAVKNNERPSAPSRKAKHVIKCVLGPRLYTEAFTGDKEARAFLELVVGDEKPKWKSDTCFTTHDETCAISTDHLEDLWEMKAPDVELPDPICANVERFLRGKWEKTTESTDKPVKTKALNGDGVTLDQLCKKHKWEARRVRQAMRSAKWVKPGGGWTWSNADAVKIEKALHILINGARKG